MAKDKNTKVVSLYLNLNNPYEKEFYSLLNKANRKKSALAGIIGHSFAQQFKDGAEGLTEADIKTYIEMYSLIQKMNMPIQQNVVGIGTATQVSPSVTPTPMSTQPKTSSAKPAIKQEHGRHTQAIMPKMPKSSTSEKAVPETKPSEITSDDMDEALNQLKAFGI